MNNSLDIELKRSLLKQRRDIYQAAREADYNLDQLTALMDLRSDYSWFKSMVSTLMPLGVGQKYSYIEEQFIRRLADEEGMTHIVNALIDELKSPVARL